MNKMLKSAFSVFLIISLVVCLFPVRVFANNDVLVKSNSSEYGKIEYSLEDILAGNVPVCFDINESFLSSYTLRASGPVSDGTYYFNNRYYGDYLRYLPSGVTAQSGLISSFSDSIRWEVVSVSNGYAIRSKEDTSKYLAVATTTSSSDVVIMTINDSTIPSRCVWNITVANGGGVLVKSAYNSRYLYANGTSVATASTLGNVGTDEYDSKVWRIANMSLYNNASASSTYKELSSFTVDTVNLKLGEPLNPEISYNSNAMWVSPSDFTYSNSDLFAADYRTGTIVGEQSGSIQVVATHKVTDKTYSFRVNVSNLPLKANCLEGATYSAKVNAGNSASALYNGISWSSSDTSVATVSSSGVVSALNSGYTFIYAVNTNGNVILSLEFKVDSVLTQQLSLFSYNEIQYLYCPTTYLSSWTDDFEVKVQLMSCLRPYYMLPEQSQPTSSELSEILLNEMNFEISDSAAAWIFNECWLGYLGQYNNEYLTSLRIQYFNYLKEIVAFCAFSLAFNLDPVNSLSNCNGYDDLIDDLAKQWGHNESSSNVMLGSNGYDGKYYYKEAQSVGYRYFYSNDYTSYANKYGDEFVRTVNIRYLERCISNNCTFYFSHNPLTAPTTSSLYMEYSYLYNYYTNLWGSVYLKQNAAGLWFFSAIP